MKRKAECTRIDIFRMIAACLIVAIHTSPFAGINETLDFLFTYCLGRIGVPFFIMVTGYFVLAPYYKGEEGAIEKVKKYLIKMLELYGICIVLYLPVNIYSGQLPKSFGEILKQLVFDGTFYHLWYLPSIILGCVFFIILMKICNNRWTGIISLLLYLIGMMGDSYYGSISQIPVLKIIFEGIFQISSYTRNGIFFVPVFLWIGMNLNWKRAYILEKIQSEKVLAAALVASIALMLAEGFLTWHFKIQRHNSMYLFLIPVMFFLFQLLRKDRGRFNWDTKKLRGISMWVYMIHPICIIVVRGCAKVLKLQSILVDNTLVHYLFVCMLSIASAVFLNYVEMKGKKVLSCIKKDEHGLKSA